VIKKLQIIINPASGQDEPILSQINKTFQDSGIDWNVSVTQKPGDAKTFADEALNSHVDVVAVYGGDGTVMEVAQALFKKETPMAIIPGGTANVMAKELHIPTETVPAMELLRKGNFTQKNIDMGLINDVPFLIRINAGIFADMIVNVDKNLKEIVGQAAYGVSAVQSLGNNQKNTYRLEVDGETIEMEGVAIIIANSGNIGFENLSFIPEIDVSDGQFDILVFKSADLTSLLTLASGTLFQKRPDSILEHLSGKQITVTIPTEQNILCDDVPYNNHELKIQIVPNAITVLVPVV
jgi:diacylglycerol kinase (ATP)